ncbi:MAG: IclR family transcriptional regulator [Caldilineaceae bacterium]|nr:IclR family transcriptional regulator [Caldilineaceae bacterium]MCB9136822.1 IclR family transcriptional regulator [Caldilineaceae bacterium]
MTNVPINPAHEGKNAHTESETESGNSTQGSKSRYQAPALEKGLDILECLAAEGIPLTQTQIARVLGRGPNELFRMLVSLERRGYVQRDDGSGAYSLTLRLFELGHTHSPYRALLRAAARPMQTLTETVLESCHMSVLQRGKLLIIAQEESPRRLRLSTEVGSTFPIINTVAGRLLLAHMHPEERSDLLMHDDDYQRLTRTQQNELSQRLDQIRAQGYDEAYGEVTEGVNVTTVLVGAPSGSIHAALTIPALGHKQEPQHADLLTALRESANEISRAAGLIL